MDLVMVMHERLRTQGELIRGQCRSIVLYSAAGMLCLCAAVAIAPLPGAYVAATEAPSWGSQVSVISAFLILWVAANALLGAGMYAVGTARNTPPLFAAPLYLFPIMYIAFAVAVVLCLILQTTRTTLCCVSAGQCGLYLYRCSLFRQTYRLVTLE